MLQKQGNGAHLKLTEQKTNNIDSKKHQKNKQLVDVWSIFWDLRKHSAWIGGSIIASVSKFSKSWITREEYRRQGVGAIVEKCIWDRSSLVQLLDL